MDTLERIDTFPTHLHGTYAVRAGRPYPFGATLVLGGVNFSVFSKHANYCILVLYRKGEPKPLVEIPFRGMFRKIGTGESTWAEFRVGNVFAMTVMDLDYENIEYGFRLDGPYPRTERGEPGQHRFDPSTVLLDPYARGIGGRDVWGAAPNWNQPFQYRSRVVSDDFDWEEDRPLEIPMESLVIYEAHLRGFTRHPSGRVKHPGTFAGLRQKIPYLKQLGVNCVELLPIFEFDEHDQSKPDPVSGEMLLNYWGYSTVGFFAPKAGYAASGSHGDATMVADELRVRGVACLGYPFHPPGQPEKLRTAHLENLVTPALIIQGTRDPFGSRDEVFRYRISPTIRIHWLEDGDHSFKPRAGSGHSERDHLYQVTEILAEFVNSLR